MRTEEEMYALILNVAKNDPRIRGVILNGSRANPNAPKDSFQDFDIVYLVKELDPFIHDQNWIDLFGPRLMLQIPETMRYPTGNGRFNWLMLFQDGNRLDLSLAPLDQADQVVSDSQSIVLLDKDGFWPSVSPASDQDYWVTPPDALFYASCCNNFWWCLQNVAKGILRDELPYAMMMFHTVVRQELHDMLSWYIGAQQGFQVSSGKMGKYFKRFLPKDMYEAYANTYSDSCPAHIWQAVFAACDLFRQAAVAVAKHFDFSYSTLDDLNMTNYLKAMASLR